MDQHPKVSFMVMTALTVCLSVWMTAGSLYAADQEVEKVYRNKCLVCHGPDGSGKTARGKKLKVNDVRSPAVQKMSDAEFLEVIVKGKGEDMGGYGKELGTEMCEKLALYMRGFAKK